MLAVPLPVLFDDGLGLPRTMSPPLRELALRALSSVTILWCGQILVHVPGKDVQDLPIEQGSTGSPGSLPVAHQDWNQPEAHCQTRSRFQ